MSGRPGAGTNRLRFSSEQPSVLPVNNPNSQSCPLILYCVAFSQIGMNNSLKPRAVISLFGAAFRETDIATVRCAHIIVFGIMVNDICPGTLVWYWSDDNYHYYRPGHASQHLPRNSNASSRGVSSALSVSLVSYIPRFLQIRLGNESCDQISASPNRPKRAKSRDTTAGSLFTRAYTLVKFSQTKRCFSSFL